MLYVLLFYSPFLGAVRSSYKVLSDLPRKQQNKQQNNAPQPRKQQSRVTPRSMKLEVVKSCMVSAFFPGVTKEKFQVLLKGFHLNGYT